MPLCPVGVVPCTQSVAPSALTLYWKDTWTVRLGAAHRVSEIFSVAGSLIWDQGATQGFTSQTDTYAASFAAVLTPNEHVEIRLDGLVGIMTGGSLSTQVPIGDVPFNPVGYTANFGDDLVYSLGASAAVRF
jgi:long-chain fatty acid transport protein